jgi:hypothetical protein
MINGIEAGRFNSIQKALAAHEVVLEIKMKEQFKTG